MDPRLIPHHRQSLEVLPSMGNGPMFGVPEVTWIYVDGSEIRRAPVDMVNIPPYLRGFVRLRWLFGISEPSTVSLNIFWSKRTSQSLRFAAFWMEIQRPTLFVDLRITQWWTAQEHFPFQKTTRMRIIHYKGATKGFELLTCAGFRRGFFLHVLVWNIGDVFFSFHRKSVGANFSIYTTGRKTDVISCCRLVMLMIWCCTVIYRLVPCVHYQKTKRNSM